MSATRSGLGTRQRPWGSVRACRPGPRRRRGRRPPQRTRPRPRHRRRHPLHCVQPHWRRASACRTMPVALRWTSAALCLAFCQLLFATPCPRQPSPWAHVPHPAHDAAETWWKTLLLLVQSRRCQLVACRACLQESLRLDWVNSLRLQGQSVPYMQDLRTIPASAALGRLALHSKKANQPQRCSNAAAEFTATRRRCVGDHWHTPGRGLICKGALVARLRSLPLSQRRLQQQTHSVLHSVSRPVSKDNAASDVRSVGSMQNK